ncbi:MAG: hypothetical protein C3F15_09935 [Holophagae bacterium]|nr:MAG: hypothetical protein C3F15_09935 [Holophagae bacterium]
MLKRILSATVAIFVAWQVLDLVIHTVILRPAYEATASMWRPMGEMKMGLMWIIGAIAAFCFAAIYGWLVRPKSLNAALKYGLLFGIGAGVSMGYGSYSVMPIPYLMAFTWFAGTVIEALVAGVLAGLIVREG